jgi:hypothetical protein
MLLRQAAIFGFAAMCVLASAQEPVTLRIRADEGQTARYSSTSNISLSAAGQSLKIVQKEESEIEVVSVSEERLRFKRTLRSGSVTINGEEGPDAPEDGEPTFYDVSPLGVLLSYEVPEDGQTEERLGERIARSTNVVFPEGETAPGAEWTHEFAADTEAGFRAALASYKFLSVEDVKGRPAAVISVSYKESGADGIGAESKIWIELESGDALRTESKFTGVQLPFAPPGTPASVDSESEIDSGSMLASTMTDDEEEVEEDPITEKVDGFEKLEGVLPLYRKEEDGDIELLLEISPEMLGRRMMLQATAATGTGTDSQIVAGSPISDLVFEFDRLANGRIVMVSPNRLFRSSDPQFSQAVRRSFSDSIVESFDIEAEHEGRILIDVSDLFTGNVAGVYELMQGGGGGNPLAALTGGGGSLAPDRENTYVLEVQNFPDNLVVASSYNFVGRGAPAQIGLGVLSSQLLPDNRGARIRLVYNLFALPEAGAFAIREADPRVGYFTSYFRDLTTIEEKDWRRLPILRWDVQKANPAARMSDPVKPIVFHLDSAIPEKYRESVAEGILAWNRAFEAIGISNAVRVEQHEDDRPMIHADMRFNTIRWVASPSDAYAVALFRSDPDTGQIMNASITVDAGIVNFGGVEYDRILNPESAFDWEARAKAQAQRLIQRPGHAECGACADAAAVLAMGALGADFIGEEYGIDRDTYVQQFVKSIVMHEMGHILGLRHNFVASTQFSLDELGDKDKVDAKTPTASIMDYLPFNPSAIKKPGVDFFNESIGDYDFQAIRFGYGTDAEAAEAARQMASRGLAWQGDEYADSFDPYVTRFDLGSDPVAYWSRMMQISRYYLMNLEEYQPKAGESNFQFTRSWNILFNVYTRSASQLTRYIGGIRRFPDFPSDTGARPSHQAIPAAKQREALLKVVDGILAENAFALPKTHFLRLTNDPKNDLIESMMGGINDYPMYSTISSIQDSAIWALLGDGALNRVQNNEFKAVPGSNPITAVEVMDLMRTRVWSELATGKAPDMLRRQLQRSHVDRLIELGAREYGSRSELGVLAFDQLRVLLGAVKSAKNSDRLVQVHYDDTVRRIERALAAVETLGGGSGGGGGSLLDLLLGGRKGGG